MKHIKALVVLALLGLATSSSAFAQRAPAGRPADAPQRPANSYGIRGERPPNAPQRPADSYGKRGQRPANAPQRPR